MLPGNELARLCSPQTSDSVSVTYKPARRGRAKRGSRTDDPKAAGTYSAHSPLSKFIFMVLEAGSPR